MPQIDKFIEDHFFPIIIMVALANAVAVAAIALLSIAH